MNKLLFLIFPIVIISCRKETKTSQQVFNYSIESNTNDLNSKSSPTIEIDGNWRRGGLKDKSKSISLNFYKRGTFDLYYHKKNENKGVYEFDGDPIHGRFSFTGDSTNLKLKLVGKNVNSGELTIDKIFNVSLIEKIKNAPQLIFHDNLSGVENDDGSPEKFTFIDYHW